MYAKIVIRATFIVQIEKIWKQRIKKICANLIYYSDRLNVYLSDYMSNELGRKWCGGYTIIEIKDHGIINNQNSINVWHYHQVMCLMKT